MSHGSGDEENYWPGYVDALTSMVQVLAFVMMLLAMAVFVLSQNVSKSAVVAISKAIEMKPDANATVEQLLGDVLAEVARLKAQAAKAAAGGASRATDKSSAPEIASTPSTQATSGPNALSPEHGETVKAETRAGVADAGLAAAEIDRSGAAVAKVGSAAGAEEKAAPKDGASAAADADRSGASAAKSETAGLETHSADGAGANSGVSRPLITRHQDPGPANGKTFVLHFPLRSFQLDPAMAGALEAFLSENQAEAAGSIEIRAYAQADNGALTEARRLAYYRVMSLRKALADRKILIARIHVYLIDTPDKSLDSAAEVTLGRSGAN